MKTIQFVYFCELANGKENILIVAKYINRAFNKIYDDIEDLLSGFNQ